MTSRFWWATILTAHASAMICGAVDFDGNGRSDVWEGMYSIPTTADNDFDKDLDGYGLLEESLLGTNPDSFQSAFRYELSTHHPDEVHLVFTGHIGKVYQFEASLDRYAPEWSPLGPVVQGDGNPITNVSSMPTESGVPIHYRIRLVGEIDEDGDGLTAWEEAVLGTSDASKDSDGDQVDDDVEFLAGTIPSLSDSDGDGVSDVYDGFPMDPLRWSSIAPVPGDTQPPSLLVVEPAGITEIP